MKPVFKLAFPIFSIVAFAAFISLFFSCSNTEPDLSVTTGTLVLDFQDETSEPDVKFSVFTTARSDTRRISSFSVEEKNSGLQWNSFSPQIFVINNIYWFGYSNFRAPEGQSFPVGRYNLLYKDLAQEEATTSFSLNYSQNILKTTALTVRSKMRPDCNEKFALYDSEDNLVYYDKRKSSWNDWSDIEQDYNIAVKSRVVYCEKDMSVMALLPFDYKNPEKKDLASKD